MANKYNAQQDTQGGVAALPTAGGADETPMSTGAGTTYTTRTPAQARTALSLDLAGLEAALPAASSSLIGARYYCTDTDETLTCVSATQWRSDGPAWKHALSGFSATAYLRTAAGTANGPTGGPGTTWAALVYCSALGAGQGVVWEYDNATTAGWHVGYGATANKLYLLQRGLAGAAAQDLATLEVGLCLLVVRSNADASIDWWAALPSGVVAKTSIAALAGAYVPPAAGSYHIVGMHDGTSPGYASTACDVIALASWDAAGGVDGLTDGEAAAIATAANRTSYRIPGVASRTKSCDFRAARDFAGTALTSRVSVYPLATTGSVILRPR